MGSIPGWGRSPGRRECQATPEFLPGKSHGQRSLAGYSPQGCKESDMTERILSINKTDNQQGPTTVQHRELCCPDGARGKESTCQCRRHKRGSFHPWVRKILEEAMATHSSILAWRIPGTEKPSRLQSIGSQRVRHD